MNKFITLSASTAVLSGLLMMAGCSSSDDGDSVATVPANAVVIDETNAETTVMLAVDSGTSFDIAVAAETTASTGLMSVLDTIKPILKDHSNNTGTDLATGIVDGGECLGPGLGGGTFSDSWTETDDGTNYSENGTVSFVNCDFGFGFILNGSITYAETGNWFTGAYTDNASGSLSIIEATNSSFSLSFNGFNFAETGNYNDGTYTITQLTYAIDFVFNGTGSGGFLISLTAPIVESNGGVFSCPESGHVTITGANGTTAEGIYNGDNTMTIKANGTVVRTDAPCYY